MSEQESSFEEEEESSQESENDKVMKKCIEAFNEKDSICEPSIFKTVKKYFNAGGTPEEVVNSLAENFDGIGNLARQLVHWLEFCGESQASIERIVEQHVKDLLIQNFDPKKADSIFVSDEGDLPGWLGDMISYPTWRNLFYMLADKHPDCIMLNFTIKLISDAGFTDEISSVSSASQQIDVFSKILNTSIASILRFRGTSLESIICDLTKLVCSSKHTYFYTMSLLHQASKDRGGGYKLRYLAQELEKRARDKGHDTCYVTLAMSGAAAYPTIYQSLTSMLTLSKNALNTGDITTLYQLYSNEDPPPVAFLRLPQLYELLIETLYSPGRKINKEHNDKYIYILAYAVSVTERWDGEQRRSINTKRLDQTITAIAKTHRLVGLNDVNEWLCEIDLVFKYLKYPVVSMGVLKYCKHVTMNESYFKGVTDTVPLHLVMIDEIATNHPLHHDTVFKFLKMLFERSHEHLQELEQIEIRKMIIDRMVHLLCSGHVVPVIQYMRYCLDNETADKSLIRYFTAEVMEYTSSPYSEEFITEFLPIAKNKDVTSSLRNINESDSISQFIEYCGR